MMQPNNRIPISTLADLNTLDDAEVMEGYHDGRENYPCGDNRSRAYFHGWRNGMMDAGHIPHDQASRALAREVVRLMREKRHSKTEH